MCTSLKPQMQIRWIPDKPNILTQSPIIIHHHIVCTSMCSSCRNSKLVQIYVYLLIDHLVKVRLGAKKINKNDKHNYKYIY